MWLSNDRVSIKPWQGISHLEALGLDEEKVTTAAYWYDDGKVTARAEAAIASALIARGHVWKLAGYSILALRPFSALAYKYIALNRHAMPGGTNACKIPVK